LKFALKLLDKGAKKSFNMPKCCLDLNDLKIFGSLNVN
jgi:hypothetical protein